jgi:(p)ppGpp synthase/HD superfamily hydrolase
VNFVATASARNRIRQWYKRSRREENMARGRHLLERELGKTGLEALLKSERMQKVAERLNYATTEDLLAGLGFGETGIAAVVNKLHQDTAKSQSSEKPILALPRASLTQAKPSGKSSETPIHGVEGLVYHLAGCCKPLPGDPIIGVVTRSNRGISIHQHDCPNIADVEGDRLLPVSWNEFAQTGRVQTYPVELQLEVIDRVGVLRDILARLTDSNINVSTAHVETAPGKPAVIHLRIDIAHKDQLTRTAVQLRQMADVLELRCVRQQGRRHC